MHKKHVQALEKGLRCLDNDALCSEDLDSLKDDLEYYLVRLEREPASWLVFWGGEGCEGKEITSGHN